MILETSQKMSPCSGTGGCFHGERGDRYFGGSTGGLRVDRIVTKEPLIKEPFLAEPDTDINKRGRHFVRQTLEVIADFASVAMFEIDEMEIIDDDELGVAGPDAINSQCGQASSCRPIGSGMPVKP